MWYGEYNHTLDEKDRFVLPAKFRDKIKGFENKKFYLTRGLDECLFMFHSTAWQGLEEKLNSLSFTKGQPRAFNRILFSGAQEIDVDSQGRVNVPDYLKEFAKINRDIVIIGVASRIEIWDKQIWKTYCSSNEDKYEETAEHLFE